MNIHSLPRAEQVCLWKLRHKSYVSCLPWPDTLSVSELITESYIHRLTSRAGSDIRNNFDDFQGYKVFLPFLRFSESRTGLRTNEFYVICFSQGLRSMSLGFYDFSVTFLKRHKVVFLSNSITPGIVCKN